MQAGWVVARGCLVFFSCLAWLACGAPADSGTEVSDAPVSPFGDGGAAVDGAPLAEICDDGLDNDENGLIDDLCPCVLADTQACFPGPGGQRGLGACRDGKQTCEGDPSGEFGAWGPCLGAVEASAEVCDAGSIDEDCDGTANDGCECVPGTAPVACGLATPPCVAGTQTCQDDGTLGDCLGAMGPWTETCNGTDDDCDGTTDEGCSCVDGAVMPCGPSEGLCEPGSQTCAGGTWGGCSGGQGPVTEICDNGLDENCNGNGDDTCTPPLVTCSASISTAPLATVTVSATGSDPDGGTLTYLWTVTSRPTGSTSTPSSPTSASTNFFVDLAGTYVLTVTVTDDEGLTATCSVTITAIPAEALHVELIWDTAYGDADLHMVQPGLGPAGYWYTAEPDCFYGNTSALWPPMGPTGNANLDIDDTNGFGPENVNVDVPVNGTYAVGVAYYCSHSVAKNPGAPITPGDGPASATVRVFCGGVLIATYDGIQLDRTGRFVDVARVTWPGCSGMSINNRTWTSLVQPAAYPAPIHCTLPCTSNADCGGGERCGPAGSCILD